MGRPNKTWPWLVQQVAARERGDECWIDWPWKGCKPEGYPMATRPGERQRSAAHLVLELDGRLRPGFEFALQISCDNPSCVNPLHIRWGTRQENMDEMVQRGRARGKEQRGESNTSAKLTNHLVREIRQRVAAGEMQKDVAADIGISRMSVSDLVRGVTWTHVP